MNIKKLTCTVGVMLTLVTLSLSCTNKDTGMLPEQAFVKPDIELGDGDVEEDPELHIARIFTQGQEGYHSYRIPCLARATNGNLIAFVEGRKNSSLDYGDIDLIYKMSYDNGQTWSDIKFVVEEGAHTWGNPTSVTDEETGRIWLFFNWNSDHHAQSGHEGPGFLPIVNWGERRVLATYSDDHGETWASPIDYTEALLPADQVWDAMGPGIGIQVQHGPTKGRLIIPAHNRNIYSDDHGETWQYKMVPTGTGEAAIVELSQGLLLRNDRPSVANWNRSRTRYISRGSIEGGFANFVGDPNLPDPVSQASILRYSWSPSRIVFLNAANNAGTGMSNRCGMTVRISYDEGETWQEQRALYPDLSRLETCEQGFGGYSSLIKTMDDRIGALVEHNPNPTAGAAINRKHSIDFHRFNLSWVKVGDN